MKNEAQTFKTPPPGYTWNPLKTYPRNAKCFCGSGKKHKICCIGLVLDCCLIEEASKLRIDWERIIKGTVTLTLKIGPATSPECLGGSSLCKDRLLSVAKDTQMR